MEAKTVAFKPLEPAYCGLSSRTAVQRSLKMNRAAESIVALDRRLLIRMTGSVRGDL